MRRIILCMLVHMGLLILLSCESDSDPHVCRLTSLRVLDDSTVFEYNTANKVERIVHHILGSDHTQEDVLEYDDNGRLIHVSFFGSDPNVAFQNYELVYDSHGYPEKLHMWGADTSAPPLVTTFFHDSKGRLIKREFLNGVDVTSYIYEYDSRDNVVRFFYKYEANPEVLGHENLLFDDRQRFFAGVSQLDVLYVYVHKFEPGKNNVTKTTFYAGGPFNVYRQPNEIVNEISYDEQGRVEYVLNLTGSFNWVYSKIKYRCN